MVTLKKVIEAIEDSGFATWDLYQVKGYNTIQKIGFFDSSTVTEEEKVKVSINQLQKTIEGWPPITAFHIQIKKATRSNGDTILNFDFSLNGKEENVNGLGAVNQGQNRNMEDELQALEKRLKVENKLQMEAFKLQQDKKEFEERKKFELEELNEKKKEIDGVAYKLGKGFGFAVEHISSLKPVRELFGLGSTEKPNEPEQPQTANERQERVTDIGTYLYENEELSETDLAQLGEAIKTLVVKFKEGK